MGRFREARSLVLYVLAPAIGAVVPLVALPAITAQYGASAFASIAIAQSLGGAAAVICELGWNVVGPQQVARLPELSRRDLYRSALATRLVALALGLPVAALLTVVIARNDIWTAVLVTTAMTFGALSTSWFAIGANRPATILLADGLPKLLLYSSAALLISLGFPLVTFGVAAVLAAVLAPVAGALLLRLPLRPRARDFAGVLAVIRAQLVITGGRGISVVYTSLPIALVGVLNPAAVPVFAAVERLVRMGLLALAAVPSRLQSWVGSPTDAELRRDRSRKSLAINALLGLIAGVGFALIAPPVASFVFSSTITIPLELSAMGGVLIFVICCSRGYGLALVATDRANSIAVSSGIAALTGVPLLLILAPIAGAFGALVSEVAAESAGLLTQAGRFHLGRRRGRD